MLHAILKPLCITQFVNNATNCSFFLPPEDGDLGPKHVVLKVKVEEKGTICCIIDGLCYT
jgi:hypothetical protein